ncbi:hypothetical protein PAXRUDRAFT_824006 [Paxillus rubicundulus Ve08.2h10]|uniref:Uncharacterized protein n=1 Tax=Paxillus rubicundulus Ve08.2h10 TaxID=930991 RepID=A0A0D0E2P2_9AGAM|nr:hypothetical protein PAXRUDRAFT_824006 [Paxillus rubicundulus Ve08.2h10]
MPGSSSELDYNKRSLDSEEYPNSPHYISARSADVILSDIRPTNLSSDALNSINALLDELLHSILSAALALTTTQLRAALHKVLPTTLGKEAVLEAELELRAFWERTGGSSSSQAVVDGSDFNLQWVFELLRLKCEAYSTLSDTDENAEAEAQLYEQMNAEGSPPPNQLLLAPASLYLTAIIESICEHILSNVGRVAARDSSRATANSQDLFIALCEDSSIYGQFKNMKVYEQIEALSKQPKPRRSKSFSRENIGGAVPPPAAPFRRDGSLNGTRPRMSSESSNTSPATVATSNIHPSRPSIDKSRAIMLFNNRASQDLPNGSEPQMGHRKTDSFASANTRQSALSKGDRSPISSTFSDDARSQEFDDMMRSGSTMKVSLTPDRLRTMEVLKDKARAHGRQKVAAKTEKLNGVETPPAVPPVLTKRGSKPVSRHIASTVIEEDHTTQKPPPTSRPRQLSAATASRYSAPSLTRVRASSTSNPSTANLDMVPPKESSRSESNPFPAPPSSVPGSTQRRKAPPQELDINSSRPPRTRTVARHQESLDLDDVMGVSDDEDMPGLKPPANKQHDRQRGLSASAKELIEFLAEGPPESPSSENSLSPTREKSGRLRKIISRITLTSVNESTKSPRKSTLGSKDATSKSMTNLSPLANKPVPPRYPTSGPPSPTSSERGSEDQEVPGSRQRARSCARKSVAAWNVKSREPDVVVQSIPSLTLGMEGVPLTTGSPGAVVSKKASESDISKHAQAAVKPLPPPTTTICVDHSTPVLAQTPPVVQPVSTPSLSLPVVVERVSSKAASVLGPKPPAAPQTPSLPPSAFEYARDMRRMLAHATSADECRLLVDMFLTATKLVADAAELKSLAATPSPEDSGVMESTSHLESTVVGLLLGDSQQDLIY